MGCVQSYFRKAHSAGLSPSSTQGSDKPPLIDKDEDAQLDKDLVIIDANEVKLAQQQDDVIKKEPAPTTPPKPSTEPKKAEDTVASPPNARPTSGGSEASVASVPAPAPTPAVKSAVKSPDDAIVEAPETEESLEKDQSRRSSAAVSPAVMPIASFPETPEPVKSPKGVDKGIEFPGKKEATSSAPVSIEDVKQESKQTTAADKDGPTLPSSPVTSAEIAKDTKVTSPTVSEKQEEEAKVAKPEEKVPTPPISGKDEISVSEVATPQKGESSATPVPAEEVPQTPTTVPEQPPPPTPDHPSPSPETGEVRPASSESTAITPTTVFVTPSVDGPQSPSGSPETGEIPTPTVSITVSPAPDRTPSSSDDDEPLPPPPPTNVTASVEKDSEDVVQESTNSTAEEVDEVRKPNDDVSSIDEVLPGSPNRQSEATTISVEESRQDSRTDTPHSIVATAGSELEDLADEEVLGVAAAKIQAGFRGYKTRKQLKASDEKESTEEKDTSDEKPKLPAEDTEASALESAATTIQANFRGYQTRQKMKEEETAEDVEKSKSAVIDSAKEVKSQVSLPTEDPSILETAATAIQASFRGYQTRQQLKKEEPSSLSDSDTKLNEENVVEQNTTPNKVEENLESIVIEADPTLLESAAATIQATFRGHKTRQELKKELKKEEKDVAVDDRPVSVVEKDVPTSKTEDKLPETDGVTPVLESAATTIQASFRGFQTRQKMKEQEVKEAVEDISSKVPETVSITVNDVDPDTLDAAATAIQATFRGHKTRQELKKSEEMESPVEDKVVSAVVNATEAGGDEALEAAATAIQATFRGHQTRQQLKKEVEETAGAASIEQQLAEACQEPEAFAAEEDPVAAAATTIQATFRGYKTRQELRVDAAERARVPSSETGEEDERPGSASSGSSSSPVGAYDKVLDAAATTIQAAFRGHHARLQLLHRKAEAKKATSVADPQEPCVPPLEDVLKTAPEKRPEEQPQQQPPAPSVSRASTLEASVPPVEDAVSTSPSLSREPSRAEAEGSVPPPEDALPPAPPTLSAQASLSERLSDAEAPVPPLEDVVKAAPKTSGSLSSQVSLADNVPDVATVDVPDHSHQPLQPGKVHDEAKKTEPKESTAAPPAKEQAVIVDASSPETSKPDEKKQQETTSGTSSQETSKSNEKTQQVTTSGMSSKETSKPEETKESSLEGKGKTALTNQPVPSPVKLDSAVPVEKSEVESLTNEHKEIPAKEASAVAKSDEKKGEMQVVQESAEIPVEDSVRKIEPVGKQKSTENQVDKSDKSISAVTEKSEVEESEKKIAHLSQKSVEEKIQPVQSSVISVTKETKEKNKPSQPLSADSTKSSVPEEAKKEMSENKAKSNESATVIEEPKISVSSEASKPHGGSEDKATEKPVVDEGKVTPSLDDNKSGENPDSAIETASQLERRASSDAAGAEAEPSSGRELGGSVESLQEPSTAPASPKDKASPPSESSGALPSPPLSSSQTSLTESLPPQPAAHQHLGVAEGDSPLTSTATPEPPSEDVLPPPPGLSSQSDSEATPVPEAPPGAVAAAAAATGADAEDSLASLPPPPPPQQGDSPPDSTSAAAAEGDASSLPPPPADDNSLTDVSMVTDTASEAGDAQPPRSPDTGEARRGQHTTQQVADLAALQRPQECAELPHQQRGATVAENSPDDLAELDEDESVSSTSVESAVTKIQAGVRGFLTRRQVQRMRTSNSQPSLQPGAVGVSLDSALSKSAAGKVETSTRSAEQLAEDGEVWETLKKEMDSAGQPGPKGVQARQKLTRGDAVRAASSGSSGGGSMDQQAPPPGPTSGELHDTVVLPPPPPPQQ